jgi:hypothetical protein
MPALPYMKAVFSEFIKGSSVTVEPTRGRELLLSRERHSIVTVLGRNVASSTCGLPERD